MARLRIKPGKRLTPFITGKCKIMQTGMKISRLELLGSEGPEHEPGDGYELLALRIQNRQQGAGELSKLR